MGAHILTPRRLTDVFLHVLGQFDAVLHVLVLYELKQDIALRRVRIIAVIGLLVVFLQEDDLVLALCHFQILHHAIVLTRATALAQGIGLETADRMALRHGIDMDGDKQVGLVLVGNLRPFIQFDEFIGLTSIDDFHTRAVLLHQSSEGQGELQREVLLLDTSITDGSCIAATMSSIDDQRKFAVCSRCDGCKTKNRYQNQQYFLIHTLPLTCKNTH